MEDTMYSHVLALSALLFVSIAPASGQVTTSSADAGKRIYNWCMKRPDGTPSECGCVAGFYAGATEDDEFRIVARMVEHLTFDGEIADQTAMIAALQEEAIGQSMSRERFGEIIDGFASFDILGAKSDAVCVPLKLEYQAQSGR